MKTWQRLRFKRAELMVMRRRERGMTFREIAEEMGLNMYGVRKLAWRAHFRVVLAQSLIEIKPKPRWRGLFWWMQDLREKNAKTCSRCGRNARLSQEKFRVPGALSYREFWMHCYCGKSGERKRNAMEAIEQWNLRNKWRKKIRWD